MQARSSLLLAGLTILAGCTPVFPDLLTFDVNGGSTVIVGTNCADPCPGDDVPVSLTLEEHIAVDTDAAVDLTQYKVELAIEGDETEIDYYADLLTVEVSSIEPAAFTVNLAAASQRTMVDNITGGESANGTATLTFAGYTPSNEEIEVTVEVPVLFGRYDSDEVSQ